MSEIRAKFEEIWPVPDGVYWSPVFEAYVCADGSYLRLKCIDRNLRLDTFTRCQETQQEIERALAGMLFAFDDGVGREWSEDLLDYARKLVAAKEYVK